MALIIIMFPAVRTFLFRNAVIQSVSSLGIMISVLYLKNKGIHSAVRAVQCEDDRGPTRVDDIHPEPAL